jgi:hypothetical protein
LLRPAAAQYRAANAADRQVNGRPRTILPEVVATQRTSPAIRTKSMSRFSSFVLGMVAGALILYAAMNFHVVRASDGFHFVNKQPPRMSEAYVDVRRFGVTDWASHPQLASALVLANKQQLLGDSAGGAIQEGLNQLVTPWPEQNNGP